MLEFLFFIFMQVELNIEGVTSDFARHEYHYAETPPTVHVFFDPIFKNGFEND